MKIAIGTDHGGYHLKKQLIQHLKSGGHQVTDAGTFSPSRCDYPVIGAKVAGAVSRGRARRGVLLCKSGAGMAIVANKFPGVRAVVAETIDSAKHAREHNDANILVLGAEQVSAPRARAILAAWLSTSFGGGRHARRVRQIEKIEASLRRKNRSC